MKKQLLLILMTLLPMVAMADAVEIDGIYYNLITKGKVAEVTTSNPNQYTGSVVIPEKVTYESVEYSVTSIGNSAFEGCKALTSVTIPNSVTSIGGYAFQYCSGLTSVTIGSGVTSIGEVAFDGCYGLKKVIVKDIAAWCGIKFDGSNSNPLYYAEHIYSDEDTEITNLIIPNSVTSIGGDAFYKCTGLTSVTIPNSVTSIGYSAFSGCSSLTSVTIPHSVTIIGGSAFGYCSGLTSVTIPNSVTSISDGAFLYCSGLTSVTIPNSVTSIGNWAFENCSGLTSVTIGSGVTSIGSSTFYGCSGLTSITIPNSVTSIGQSAFFGCSKLTTITIGSGIKTIYSSAFASCPELTDVTCYAENVPSTNTDAFKDSYIEYTTLHVPASAVNAYKAADPWKNFKSIMATDGTTPETPETPKCEKPTISYENGQLKMSCATEGVEYVTDITDADIKKHYDATISLTATYNISVYATKSGYDNSDVATATLVWNTATFTETTAPTAVRELTRDAPLLIQSHDGVITIQGADDGQQVRVYGIDGTQAGAAFSNNGQATVGTNLKVGSVAIIKIGDRSVKVVVK